MMDKQIPRLLVHGNIQIMPKANDVSMKSTYSWCDLLRLNSGSWFSLVDKISLIYSISSDQMKVHFETDFLRCRQVN
jgi:hypothetical protein